MLLMTTCSSHVSADLGIGLAALRGAPELAGSTRLWRRSCVRARPLELLASPLFALTAAPFSALTGFLDVSEV